MKSKDFLKKINEGIKENLSGNYESSNLKKYKSSNPLKKFFINRFLYNVVDSVCTYEFQKVIDIGCGEGFIIKSLSLNFNYRFNACDVNIDAAKSAKKLNPDITVFVADINSLPMRDCEYDLVICCEVLEHLQTPQRALEEIKRISTGLILLSVPYEPYFSLMNFLTGKNLRAFGNDPDHFQKWSKKEFAEVLMKDFEIITLKVSLPWLIVLCRVK